MSGHANQQDDHATDVVGGPPAATYLAECFWPGVNATKLAETATRIAGHTDATCIELILIPGDEIVLGVFRAPSAAAVTQVSRRAGLPAERVVRSLHVTPHDIEAVPTPRRARAPDRADDRDRHD